MDNVGNRQLACKSVKVSKKNRDQLKREADILLGLDHVRNYTSTDVSPAADLCGRSTMKPNINKVVDIIEDGGFLHIFLQLCTGGDLFTYMETHRDRQGDAHLCESEAKFIMYQLLKGLKYLHDRKISHRDIKPENILLVAPGSYPHIQIADFGLARPNGYQETLNACGTVSYLPPEGIMALEHEDFGYVGMPADCWSAGIVLYIMLSGSHPFDRSGSLSDEVSGRLDTVKHDAITKKRIAKGKAHFPRYHWSGIPDAQGLIELLLTYDYLQRATINQALESKWIASEFDELKEAYTKRVASD
ncbi:hypothetical protein EW146_g1279 [Bondarzewia mesenterica]|uniref:Protein kinase domain-containing protein n=1 Tax=Bondarzewia mesenterica TaxID=1095465 RepID=A0A4S4M4A9_9AGAM|nr:hypothetical protein EW146_g1279 [Bondarzewia mesenterica]